MAIADRFTRYQIASEAFRQSRRQWYVRERFARVSGTESVYDVLRDGVVIDTFATRDLADAHANYRNRDTDTEV